MRKAKTKRMDLVAAGSKMLHTSIQIASTPRKGQIIQVKKSPTVFNRFKILYVDLIVSQKGDEEEYYEAYVEKMGDTISIYQRGRNNADA